MKPFNLSRLKDYIPEDVKNLQLPHMPSWPLNDNGDSGRISQQDHESKSETLCSEGLEPTGPRTNLDLVGECDNFPYLHTDPELFFASLNTYYGLRVKAHPDVELGYVLPSVAEVFRGLPDWNLDDENRSLTLMTGNTEAERTSAVSFATEAMRATDHFKILRGWRNELYPVYGPAGDVLFNIERAASALFGVVTYGCHLTAYTIEAEDGGTRQMRIWVARRAQTKQTYPGMLDNTVGGGISSGEQVFESMIREAREEAGLPEEVLRKKAKAVGTVTYFHIRDRRAGGETRLLQPECQYVYDLELAGDVVLQPSDGEVANFELKTVAEAQEALKNGEFKPNCAMVLLDFLVRHGTLTPADAGYIEIVARLHRRLEFPMP